MKPERSILSAVCILVASQLFSPVETIQAAEIKAVDPGETLPEIGKALDIKFISLDGKLVDLRALKGKVVLIDFWATWCPPCARQFSKIKQTYEKYHDRGLEIVGISLD